jgi:D-inositol-3-phosphate glycosyltransferase
LNVFLSFTFSTYRYVGVPVVHYCDRTYEQHLEETDRTPTRTDRAFMRIDQRNIENADMVLSTNQTCCDFITRRYKPKRAFCLTPGINTEAAVRDPERLINEKENSTDILFIGTGAHQRGADILIRAFKLFNDRRHRRFTLHIVGIKPRDLPEELRAPDHSIRFYGYLDRSVPADLERYNNLLRSAKMFVMPTRPAPFPGVISEVQLHCTPIIGSNVPDMSEVLAHGRDSVLVDGLEPHDYATQMDRLVLDVPAWRQMALNGYISRRNSTWTNTVETFLSMIRDTNLVATGR